MKQGIVIKSTGSRYLVKEESGDVTSCTIRGKFRLDGIRTTNPVAVGDNVEFIIDDKQEVGVIKKIAKRKNYIIRKSSNLSKQSQILAANIDQAILLVTVSHPETYPIFIDRFLITAQAYRIPCTLIFNKIDLYDEDDNAKLEYYMDVYQNAGYSCIKTSVKENINLDLVKELLQNKISLVSGNSGVGKSSIINAIDGNLDLKTQHISESHSTGKHTTTFAKMFELSFGGSIIDTPGIRGFGLIDIEKEELFHFFPEIFNVSHDCKYNNCTHAQEPGCAVKDAVVNGEISELRYNNYLSILFDEEDKHRL